MASDAVVNLMGFSMALVRYRLQTFGFIYDTLFEDTFCFNCIQKIIQINWILWIADLAENTSEMEKHTVLLDILGIYMYSKNGIGLGSLFSAENLQYLWKGAR